MPVYGLSEMKNTFFFIQVIIIICLHSTELRSQNSDKIYWFNVGVSEAYTESNRNYINFGFSLNLKATSFSHQFGLSTTSSFFGGNEKLILNYGIGHSFLIKDIMISSLTIGPSLTLGKQKNYEDIEEKFFRAIGIIINAQLYAAPLFFILPEIAIGIEPYLNYNIYESANSNMRLLYGVRFGFNFNSNN
jgi:hypothetical protein